MRSNIWKDLTLFRNLLLCSVILINAHAAPNNVPGTIFPKPTKSETEEQYEQVYRDMDEANAQSWDNSPRKGNFSVYLRFHNRGIAPYVIRRGPFFFLNATYKSGHHARDGNKLKRAFVKEPPVYIHWNTNKNKPRLYFLLHTNLDDTNDTDTRLKPHHIWIVCNIPGCNVKRGDVALEYESPNPDDFWGLNRCAYFAFPQEYRLDVNEVKEFINRGNTSREGYEVYDLINRFDLEDCRAGSFYCLLE